jgi:hypothetical protein
LTDGRVQAEERNDQKNKNLLKVGLISPEEVIKIVSNTRGHQYRTEPHKDVLEIQVHFFQPIYKGKSWYIKCYFLEPDCWFISVHPSHKKGVLK